MKQDAIAKAFDAFLRKRSLKLTAQRRTILERAFATHEHFSAEQLYRWLASESTAKVSRATVYRTLALLQEGEFIAALDVGRGELLYEHVLGHRHHDHMICLACGKIEEFHDSRIEALQNGICVEKGFELVNHTHRLLGYCRACAGQRRKDAKAGAPAGRTHAHKTSAAARRASQSGA